MEHKCAWCKVDVENQPKFKTEELTDGICHQCGSWNDIGQQVITVNSMKQIYQGCLNLMQYIADECSEMLEAAGIDTNDIKEALDMEKDEVLSIKVSTWQIVKLLFLMHGSSGGTSTGNMMRRLGLEQEDVEFCIEEEQEDD